MRHVWVTLTLLSAAIVSPVRGHDFWIMPATFRPAAGALVELELAVGQSFAGEPVPRISPLIERFVARGAAGETPVPGLDGRTPAGVARPASAGPLWIGYQSRASYLESDAETFERYLAEEGLEDISRLRASRGESGTPGFEAFFRSAKALLCVGDVRVAIAPGVPDGETVPVAALASSGGESSSEVKASGGTLDAASGALGLTLELIPESPLCAVRSGDRVPLRLLYRGEPLAGALVAALPRDAPADRAEARSDGHGRVLLALDRPGAWLIKAVHLVPAESGDVEWHSFWASLTLEVR